MEKKILDLDNIIKLLEKMSWKQNHSEKTDNVMYQDRYLAFSK